MRNFLRREPSLITDEEWDSLTNPTLLEDMSFDYMVYRFNHRGYSDWYIWKIWLKGW